MLGKWCEEDINEGLIFFQTVFGGLIRDTLWPVRAREEECNSMKLLVIEDERRMLALLNKGLSEEGHTVSCATDGAEGLQALREHDFDAVILDVMMPKMNGFEFAQRMRSENNGTPLLMLTAKDSVPDIVHGLEIGADDYITKPFSFDELLLRLRAVRRAVASPRKTQLQVADLRLNVSTREVSRGGERISLTRTEYQLLEQLMLHAGEVVPREKLIASSGREMGSNLLDAFVRLLRQKIDCDHRSKLIHTVRGRGYLIELDRQS
jgi:two-component system copper resistance phosphate regulon response regulator CusR